MATGVWSWSTTAADNSNADSTINWSEGQDPSTVNDSARAEMAGIAKYLLDTHGALTTTGSANTYSVTTNSSRASLADGQGLGLVINVACTGASTLNTDATGAKAVKKITSAGEADTAEGDMIAAGHYIFDYDESANSAAGAWILLNPTPAAATSFLSNVVEDTSPQLGGDLDVNSNGIAFGGATVTDVTGEDTKLVSGTAGTGGNLVGWDASGDAVDSGVAANDVVVDGDIGTTVQAQGATLDTIEALSLVQGDILYATGPDTVVRLAKGTALQKLQMNAGATAPEWATASAGSFSKVVNAVTLSGASYALTSFDYDEAYIFMDDPLPSGNNAQLRLRFSDDGGSTDETSGYVSWVGAETSFANIYSSTSWDTAASVGFLIHIVRIGTEMLVSGNNSATNSNLNATVFDNGNAVDALKLYPDIGTFAGGTITIWAK